jgi:hypothetical protein
MALALPWLIQPKQALALPLPPTPYQHTITYTHTQRVVAMSTGSPTMSTLTQATPAFQPNDAPVLLATDTP